MPCRLSLLEDGESGGGGGRAPPLEDVRRCFAEKIERFARHLTGECVVPVNCQVHAQRHGCSWAAEVREMINPASSYAGCSAQVLFAPSSEPLAPSRWQIWL